MECRWTYIEKAQRGEMEGAELWRGYRLAATELKSRHEKDGGH